MLITSLIAFIKEIKYMPYVIFTIFIVLFMLCNRLYFLEKLSTMLDRTSETQKTLQWTSSNKLPEEADTNTYIQNKYTLLKEAHTSRKSTHFLKKHTLPENEHISRLASIRHIMVTRLSIIMVLHIHDHIIHHNFTIMWLLEPRQILHMNLIILFSLTYPSQNQSIITQIM